MARSYRMVVEQGVQKLVPIRVWTDKTKTSMRDLTGYVVRMQARRHAESDETVVDISSATDAITVSDGTGTENILIDLDTALTTALPAPFEGRYNIEIEKPDGEVWKRIKGDFIIDAEIAR